MTPFLTHLLAATVIIALTVPGFVLAVRALPAVDRRALAGQKPWACDICMCFWSTGLWALVVAFVLKDPRLVLACGPAYTGAMMLLKRMTAAPPGGPMLEAPPLEEHGLAEKLEPSRSA